MTTTREQLLEELLRERYAPTPPAPVRRQPPARQADRTETRARRRSGTGWPA